MMKVEIENGKYAIEIEEDSGQVLLLRYNEAWVAKPQAVKMLIAVAYELDCLRAEVASLKEELSKFQESSFNPDWSLLQSTQESLREHMALLHQQNSQIEVLKDLLERAQNGLRWYADMHPEDASEADGEMHVEIDEALA